MLPKEKNDVDSEVEVDVDVDLELDEGEDSVEDVIEIKRDEDS